ncbi:MAG TPA: hypothetical protein PK586_04420 [Casimicrobium sp.]|nr:hypothetical protein [Casimicrobium sp.]
MNRRRKDSGLAGDEQGDGALSAVGAVFVASMQRSGIEGRAYGWVQHGQARPSPRLHPVVVGLL